MTDAPSAPALRRTLLVGGVLLIVSAVLTFAQSSLLFAQTSMLFSPVSGVLFWAAVLAFSAAVLVFAFGIGRDGSVVRRRPLAVTAAVIVAVWPLIDRILSWIMPYESAPDFYRAWAYLTWTVTLAASIVFVVQIARAGVLRGRERWMPLWGLALVVTPQVLTQLLYVAVSPAPSTDDGEWIALVWGLGQLLSFAVPVALGILAIIIANRPASVGEPVQVYPPAA